MWFVFVKFIPCLEAQRVPELEYLYSDIATSMSLSYSLFRYSNQNYLLFPLDGLSEIGVRSATVLLPAALNGTARFQNTSALRSVSDQLRRNSLNEPLSHRFPLSLDARKLKSAYLQRDSRLVTRFFVRHGGKTRRNSAELTFPAHIFAAGRDVKFPSAAVAAELRNGYHRRAVVLNVGWICGCRHISTV